MTYRKQAGFAVATGFLLLVLGLVSAVASERATTTVYIGRHFEVRDHDQPVKYVFSGDTRVARLTGSLSNNSRIQRFRLQPGWNHCSMAVGNATLPVRAEIDQAYRWNPISGQYESVGVQDSLAAGTVLWLKANAPAVISMTGTYLPPVPTTWPAGKTFVGGTGLEAMSLTLPSGVTVWKFEATSQSWRAGLAGDLASVKELPPKLVPGEAIYVHAPEPIAAPVPDPARRIAYYHQDHLGSSSVVTDATGALLEETAYHPFGATRYEYRPQALEANYGFTQKERDRESGLHYFEARYLAGSLARFISADPKFTHPDSLSSAELDAFLRRPQKLNPLAYVLNQPLNHTDSTGLDEAQGKPVREGTSQPPLKGAMYDRPIGPMPMLKTEAILTLKESGGGKTHQVVIESFMTDTYGSARRYGGGSAVGQGRSPAASDVHLVRKIDRLSHELWGAAVYGKRYESATIIVRTKGPQSAVVMKVTLSDVFVSGYQSSGNWGGAQDIEQVSLNFTDISISHPDPNTDEASSAPGSSPSPKSSKPNP